MGQINRSLVQCGCALTGEGMIAPALVTRSAPTTRVLDATITKVRRAYARRWYDAEGTKHPDAWEAPRRVEGSER
jgi:hypothetical protein